MNNNIQKSLDILLKKSHFQKQDISQFGKDIAPLLLSLDKDETTKTVDTIYKSLLRKGTLAFPRYNASNYARFVGLDLYSGLSSDINNQSPDNSSYLKTINSLLSKETLNTEETIIKEVAFMLEDKPTTKKISILSANLSKYIVDYTLNSNQSSNYVTFTNIKQKEIEVIPSSLVDFWKNVKEELVRTNRADIVDKVKEKVMEDLQQNTFLANNAQLKQIFTKTLSEGFSDTYKNSYEDVATISTRIAQIRKDATVQVIKNPTLKK